MVIPYDFLYVEFSDDGGANWHWYYDEIEGYQDDGCFWAQVPEEMCTDQFRFRLRLVADERGNRRRGVHRLHRSPAPSRLTEPKRTTRG